MRKLLLGSVAMALGLWAIPAQADVDVFARIDKTKTVTITEVIVITKTVDLQGVVVSIAAQKAAESDAIINQINRRNNACSNCAEKTDSISNSFNGNSGVVSTNQAAGNMNNQGNAIAAATDLGGGGGEQPPEPPTGTFPGGFAESQAAADQLNGVARTPGTGPDDKSTYEDRGNTADSINLVFRNALIIGSYNGNTGIVQANQAAGNMANQANALSLAVSNADQGVALAEADLGQVNAYNDVLESDAGGGLFVGINKLALLRGSVNGNQGIVGLNQSSGNMANQSNVVAASFVQPF